MHDVQRISSDLKKQVSALSKTVTELEQQVCELEGKKVVYFNLRETRAATVIREMLADGPIEGPVIKNAVFKQVGNDKSLVYTVASKLGVQITPNVSEGHGSGPCVSDVTAICQCVTVTLRCDAPKGETCSHYHSNWDKEE